MTNPTLTDIPVVLDQAHTLTVPALRQVIAGLHADLAAVAAYHCGLSDRNGWPVTSGGGKMLRPALVFLSARATGAAPATVVAGAVAVQLVHEFSLLHDDIMDRDHSRRGRPSAWTVFGINSAILAGDALLASAVSLLTDNPHAETVLATAMGRLCAGEADDLALQSRGGTVTDWERMAANKTGALMWASCQIGALLGGGDPRTAAVLGRVGTELGLAFQALDDWLGIWGDPQATGKPVGADIAARKRSMPIVATLAGPCRESAQVLAAILAREGDLSADDIAEATAVLEQARAGEVTRRHARQHAALALDALTESVIPPRVRREWDQLITFATTRTV
jgi:geranylgeranyl diphosphate synthase type I